MKRLKADIIVISAGTAGLAAAAGRIAAENALEYIRSIKVRDRKRGWQNRAVMTPDKKEH
jgi:hypothetical protein